MPPPNVPEAYLQARREQIIQAAVQCFTQKGFHQTTMQDICRAAQLSPGAVYNYFKSKEDIVAACADMAQRRNDSMMPVAAADKDMLATFKEVGSAWFSMLKQDCTAEGVKFDMELWAEAGRNERVADSLRKTMDAVKVRLSEFVEKAQAAGYFDPSLDKDAIAQVLFSMVNGLGPQVVLDPDLDVDAYAAVCFAMVDGSFARNRAKSGSGE